MGDANPFEGRPLVGDVVVGKYRIESVAGEGGMGIVYEAEHVILRQRVALKVLPPGVIASADAVARFSTEAAAIARITSEHVVRVMDAGLLPTGAPYLVMEYLDGCDLEQLLAQRGLLPTAEVVDFALQALEALAHAHAAHVIHRDLKPANLFLARCPDGRQIIKLLDFGIAKSFDLSAEDDRIVGSPVYMSPEQIANAPLDGRSDLWSVGVVLYELLSGSPPFIGTFSELVAAIIRTDAETLHKQVPHLSRALSEIIAKCLRRDRAARWATTAELARALAPFGSGAWTGALERIDRALSQTMPMRAPRRFETPETALQALEGDGNVEPDDNLEAEGSSAGVYERDDAAFSLTLPAPPSSNAIETAPPASTRASLRILLVDESKVGLGTHLPALVRVGFDVRTTTSPREVEALLESWKPHLVLMGVQSPDVSGHELCRRLKSKFKASMPIAFVSALSTKALAERAKIGGADAFFSTTEGAAGLVDFVKNLCALTYSPEDLPDALLEDL